MNELGQKLAIDKLACQIHQERGCLWEEAFNEAEIMLFGGEE